MENAEPGKTRYLDSFHAVLLEPTLNFENFETKINLIAKMFLKLLTPKDVIT